MRRMNLRVRCPDDMGIGGDLERVNLRWIVYHYRVVNRTLDIGSVAIRLSIARAASAASSNLNHFGSSTIACANCGINAEVRLQTVQDMSI